MYTTFDTIVPPSSVTHAATARLFADAGRTALVVVRSNYMDIYDCADMVLLRTVRFHDRIGSLCVLPAVAPSPSSPAEEHAADRTPCHPTDRLLVAFKEAKAAVMAWDEDLQDMLNVSLHFFEKPEHMDAYRVDELAAPMLRADPLGRCALMRVYQKGVAMFVPGSAATATSFFRWTQLDARMRRRVVDFCFLPDFREPTVAVLYTTGTTDVARCEMLRDTCAVAVISVLGGGSFSTIAHYGGLPFDCCALAACSEDGVSSVLITSTNGFIHVEPAAGSHTASLAVNPYVERTSAFRWSSMQPLFRSLLGAATAQVAPGLVGVFLMEEGTAHVLRLHRSGRRVSRLSVHPVRSDLVFTGPACVAPVGEQVFFFGSATVDAKLLRFENASATEQHADAALDAEEAFLYGKGTRRTLDDDAWTIGAALATMPCCGHVLDGASIDEETLVVPSGRHAEARLNLLHLAVPLSVDSSFRIRHARALFALQVRGEARYLVVSTATASMAMCRLSDAAMEEVQESGFYLEGPTLLACHLSPALFVQVFQGGLRVIDAEDLSCVGEQAIEGMLIGGAVRKAAFANDTLAILLAAGSLLLLRWNGRGGFDVLPAVPDVCAFCWFEADLVVALADGSLRCGPAATFPGMAGLPSVCSTDNPPRCGSRIHDVHVMRAGRLMFLLVVTEEGLLRVYRWHAGSWHALALHEDRPCAPGLITSIADGTVCIPNGRQLPRLVHFGPRAYPRVHRLAVRCTAVAPFGARLAFLDGSTVCIADGIACDLDWDTPLTRLPLLNKGPGLVTHVTHHGASSTVAFAWARPAPFTLPNDEFAPITDNLAWRPLADDAFNAGMSLAFELCLVSPLTWTVIDSMPLMDDQLHYEHVTCMRELPLRRFKDRFSSKPLHYLAVGTTWCKSEDRPNRGRILLIEVISVVPQEDRPETNRRFKLIRGESIRAPVTALSVMHGTYVVAGCATKIIVHSFGRTEEEDEQDEGALAGADDDDDALNGVAFVEIHCGVQSIACLKSFFAVADVGRSCSLLAFQEEEPVKIHPLSKDASPLYSQHVEMMLQGGELMLVAAADYGLYFFVYAPWHAKSLRGERLMPKGALAFPSPIVRIHRQALNGNLLGVLVFLLDGSVVAVRPCASPAVEAFNALYALQNALVTALPSPGGLHPRQSRQVRTVQAAGGAVPLATHALDMSFLRAFWTDSRLLCAVNESAGENEESITSVLRGVEARQALSERVVADADDSMAALLAHFLSLHHHPRRK